MDPLRRVRHAGTSDNEVVGGSEEGTGLFVQPPSGIGGVGEAADHGGVPSGDR